MTTEKSRNARDFAIIADVVDAVNDMSLSALRLIFAFALTGADVDLQAGALTGGKRLERCARARATATIIGFPIENIQDGACMPTKRERRYQSLQEIGCMACREYGFYQPADMHHQLSGNKRIGDEATVPLCPYHHRNVWHDRFTSIKLAKDVTRAVARR